MLKNFNSNDRRIFTIAALVFLLMMSLTLTDEWIGYFSPTVEKDLVEIGSVAASKNDVRRRYKVEFGWSSLKQENMIYQGDTIFTGDNSTTVIRTKDGDEIVVAPNSLVVINTDNDTINIDIGFGSIEGNLPAGKKVVISSNNKITELAGDKAKIRIDAGAGDSLVLDVLEGKVSVRDGGKTSTLKQFDLAELSGEGFRDKNETNVEALAPLRDQRFRYFPDRSIAFQWKTFKEQKRGFLKVATDPEFKNTVLKTAVRDTSHVAYNLPKDKKLYWTVVGEGLNGEVSEFWILDTKAPTPVQPQQGKHFYFDPDMKENYPGSRVTLEWANGSPSRKYEVQIAKSADFQQAMQKFVSDVNKFQTPLLSAGNYHWRVRGMEFPDSEWSTAFTFKIGPEPSKFIVPPAPMADPGFLLLTKNHQVPASEFSQFDKKKWLEYVTSPLKLEWSKVAGAIKYELQVATDRKFTDTVLTKTLTKPVYQWKDAVPGLYFWRVRAINEGEYLSKYTRTESFQVKVAPPVANNLEIIEEEVTDRELMLLPIGTPVEISWVPTVFTGQYEVLFAENIRFDKAIRFVTSQSQRKVQIPRMGVYFWKVRALSARGGILSDFSDAQTVEFRRVFRDPRLSENLLTIAPKMNDAILMVGKGNSEILFEWSKPFENAEYELQVSDEPKFSKLLYKARTKKNFHALKQQLSSKDIFWRVRAYKGNGLTEWTAISKFFLSYEQTPYDAETFEMLYMARAKAKERQKKIIAAMNRRLQKLREPAGTADIQLDKPELIKPEPVILLSGNYDPAIKSMALAKQSTSQFQRQVANYPRLEWKKVIAAERYFIEIASDPDFRKVVLKQPSTDTYYVWETPEPGRYYFRVQAFNDRYSRSEYSQAERFQLEVTRPESSSPEIVAEVMSDPKEMWPLPSPFKLKWTPRIFAKNYEFEFSENPSFDISKVFLTAAAEKEVQVSKPGQYYWRVRPVNDAGVGISHWSDAYTVEVSQTLRKPASETEPDPIFPLNRTIIQVGKGMLDLAFHFAGRLNPSSVIEVSNSASFEKILSIGKPEKNKAMIHLNQKSPTGRLFWRVRDNSMRGPASKQPVYEFSFQREEEPYRHEK